jgi:transposase-like protein
MTTNPKCPSCGHAMWLTRTVTAPHPADDQHVFQCQNCKLTYMTEDHTPVSGESARA